MTGIRTLLDGRAFLEGPRWHAGALWCSDMHGDAVLRIDADGTPTVVAEIPQPSGLGWLPDGTLLVVAMAERAVMAVRDGTVHRHADLRGLARSDVNDMVVDRHGHAFVGQLGYDLDTAGQDWVTAPLLRVDPDGQVEEAAPDLAMANGMVVTPDGATLIVAETFGARLTAFDLAPDGRLSGRRTWAEVPDGPDGICLDARGAVWCAGPVTDRFVRVREGGAITDIVDTPGRHAIACVLGGPDGHELHLCTAETFGQRAASQAARSAAIEVLRVDVPGPA